MFLILIVLMMVFANPASASEPPATRDPLTWPFSSDSIWNIPIGDKAVYVPAQIAPANGRGMTVDEDIIILTPHAPLTPVYHHSAGWDRNKDRTAIAGDVLFTLPMPGDFVVNKSTWDGVTPNAALAGLMPDGRTLVQCQPFARGTVGGPATCQYRSNTADIYGEGTLGAHGGSGLSSIGGTLRVGELVPSGVIHHALKVNVFAARNLYYDAETRGFRWPARKADSYAARSYNGKVKEMRMGALLALPPSINIANMGLETEPASILAQAFQDYGAYVADDTAWDVYAITTEWGPAGRVTEEFRRLWGFEINPKSTNTPWARDMRRIFIALNVISNNGPDNVGGGGSPRRPLAPPLMSPTSGW